MSGLSSLENHSIKNKIVLMRIDSDVDVHSGRILDDTRLLSSLYSLKKLLKNNCKVILVGHLGRPYGHDISCTLRPIARWYAHVLKTTVKENISPFGGWKIGNDVTLFENIRYFTEEEQNEGSFSQTLASTAQVFVNEAFAVSHRSHASTVGIAELLPSYAGLHFSQEVEELEKVLHFPKRPLVVIIGGAKIETKLPMVERMHEVADYVLVGGEVAEHTKELITVQHDRSVKKKSIVLVADLITSGLDITGNSAENFAQIIESAQTIVWNGPVGQTGKDPITERGTRIVAEAISNSHAYSIVGGGDTISYLSQHKLLEKFNFVSVGGGAMLEFLSGKKLPAIEVLRR